MNTFMDCWAIKYVLCTREHLAVFCKNFLYSRWGKDYSLRVWEEGFVLWWNYSVKYCGRIAFIIRKSKLTHSSVKIRVPICCNGYVRVYLIVEEFQQQLVLVLRVSFYSIEIIFSLEFAPWTILTAICCRSPAPHLIWNDSQWPSIWCCKKLTLHFFFSDYTVQLYFLSIRTAFFVFNWLYLYQKRVSIRWKNRGFQFIDLYFLRRSFPSQALKITMSEQKVFPWFKWLS